MASNSTNGGGGLDSNRRLVFRCHGCIVRFPDDAVGPGTCPRCGAIGGHDRLGRPENGG